MYDILKQYRLSQGPLSRGGFARSVAVMVLSTTAATCLFTWPSRMLLSEGAAEIVIAVITNIWIIVMMIGTRAIARRRLLALQANLAEADMFFVTAIIATFLFHMGIISSEGELAVEFGQFMSLLRREPSEKIVTWG